MRPDVAEASMQLATEGGYPVLTVSGRFVHDARCAWLIEAVETWHEALHVPRYRPGWFSASALGKSDEELITAYRGEDSGEVHDAQKLRIFDLGHNRDAAWKGYLSQCGLSAVVEDEDRKISIPHLRLVGECDDIVRSPAGFSVFEFKTINPFQFQRLDAPMEAHVLQVTAYMAGLALRDAIIVYENKADSALRAFPVDFDQSLWDGIAARLRRLRAEAEASG